MGTTRRADTPLRATRRLHHARVKFGRVPGLIFERFESPGRRTGRPRLGYLRGQAEVSQDALHHGRVFNQRHHAQPPAAVLVLVGLD
jgi:hypothetical protein